MGQNCSVENRSMLAEHGLDLLRILKNQDE